MQRRQTDDEVGVKAPCTPCEGEARTRQKESGTGGRLAQAEGQSACLIRKHTHTNTHTHTQTHTRMGRAETRERVKVKTKLVPVGQWLLSLCCLLLPPPAPIHPAATCCALVCHPSMAAVRCMSWLAGDEESARLQASRRFYTRGLQHWPFSSWPPAIYPHGALPLLQHAPDVWPPRWPPPRRKKAGSQEEKALGPV